MTALVCLLGTMLIGIARPAFAVGSYDNGAIADKALAYWGGSNGTVWGGKACQEAAKAEPYPGQCRGFVNCIVWMVSGKTQNLGGSDYFQPFLAAGGVEIKDVNALVKGDIVQNGQGVHTFIIVSKTGPGQFKVVDSNHNNDERVWYYQRPSRWIPRTAPSAWVPSALLART